MAVRSQKIPLCGVNIDKVTVYLKVQNNKAFKLKDYEPALYRALSNLKSIVFESTDIFPRLLQVGYRMG